MSAPAVALPRPYYQDDLVTLYHGDCLELLPLIEADLLVTDPPYGISWTRGANEARCSKAHEGIANDHDTSVRDSVLEFWGYRPGVVFGSFYAPFPARLKQVLVWHKPPDSGLVGSVTGYRRDVEPIFLVGKWPTRTIERSSVLHVRSGQAGAVVETGHPHTKPVQLMANLLASAPGGVVLDPFMGSGSSLVAAKLLWRKAIGIELDEAWCEVAAKRLSQETIELV